ncbi:MAG TPA: hypothetical protein ENH91_05230 [Leeuwenhoekiella sp.]|nr:hypothetical protein [Leeuwenhoekiella sp.]
MKRKEIEEIIQTYATNCMSDSAQEWLKDKTKKILEEESSREFFLTYTLLAQKVTAEPIKFKGETEVENYLKKQEANVLEIARIYFLNTILTANTAVFTPQVAKIIQVADAKELETFLKYLLFLPQLEAFKMVAVDALRTNIASVFDALALYNSYPAEYFEDKQWNQMFLKAAFMQRPLQHIVQVDQRANEDLARIISDYAHERWAAGRDIDPYFWRPVAGFINETLLRDMQRLLASDNSAARKAAALCCHKSENQEAKKLLVNYPELYQLAESDKLNWNTIYN